MAWDWTTPPHHHHQQTNHILYKDSTCLANQMARCRLVMEFVTCPVNGFVMQQWVESNRPATLNCGTFCFWNTRWQHSLGAWFWLKRLTDWLTDWLTGSVTETGLVIQGSNCGMYSSTFLYSLMSSKISWTKCKPIFRCVSEGFRYIFGSLKFCLKSLIPLCIPLYTLVYYTLVFYTK